MQALLNQNLRRASYQLDGTLIIPGQKPNLSSALRQNRALRSKDLFHLSDGSVLTGEPQPIPPNVLSAMKGDGLRGRNIR